MNTKESAIGELVQAFKQAFRGKPFANNDEFPEKEWIEDAKQDESNYNAVDQNNSQFEPGKLAWHDSEEYTLADVQKQKSNEI